MIQYILSLIIGLILTIVIILNQINYLYLIPSLALTLFGAYNTNKHWYTTQI